MDVKSELDFNTFFKSFYNPVCMFIARILPGDEENVIDVAQEGFLKTYRKWKTFESEENAQAFLFIAVRNCCLNIIRHRQSEKKYFSSCENDIGQDEVFLDEVMRQETYRILHVAIDTLPQQTRNVVILGMEGNNNQQTADKLNISINSVKTLKKNAYSSLRKFLSKEYLFLLVNLLYH